MGFIRQTGWDGGATRGPIAVEGQELTFAFRGYSGKPLMIRWPRDEPRQRILCGFARRADREACRKRTRRITRLESGLDCHGVQSPGFSSRL